MKSVPEILSEIRPECDFTKSADFIGDGLLDSFDLLTLVAALESVYLIRIDGSAIAPANFGSIAAIEHLVASSRKR